MDSFPLTIETVPETCWFSNVRTNVSTEDWDKLRREAYRRAGYRCEICSGRGTEHPVECHERWNYDDESHTQTLLGLIALCPACHRVKHIGLAFKEGHGGRAMEHLAQVNGWNLVETLEYVEEAREIWENRSRHEWKLDLSWLEQRQIDILGSARRSERSEASAPAGEEVDESTTTASFESDTAVATVVSSGLKGSRVSEQSVPAWLYVAGAIFLVAAILRNLLFFFGDSQ